jgi:hypothetical protein
MQARASPGAQMSKLDSSVSGRRQVSSKVKGTESLGTGGEASFVGGGWQLAAAGRHSPNSCEMLASEVAATALALSAWSMRRHANTVSGFLSANRLAGRYLLTVSYNMAQVGVITLVWYFQVGYDVGFTQYWWGYMEGPSLILLAVTGWVIYRFRETRAMTLAQFFEMRYSRRCRIFSGIGALSDKL